MTVISPITFDYHPDAGPGRHRIGLILLSNDYATERDFINARPNDDVVFLSTRVENTAYCAPKSLALMEPRIANAARLIVPEGRLDVIVYSCTSGTVVIGYDRICELVHEVRPGIPVVTPISASLAGMACFGAKKLAVLTPYTDNVNHLIACHLKAHGMEICKFSSFGISDNEAMAKLPTDAILRAGNEADHAEAEALFISCTAIRAMDVVKQLEQELSKPVITANQAMIWQSLRWSGCVEQIQGYGKLLELADLNTHWRT